MLRRKRYSDGMRYVLVSKRQPRKVLYRFGKRPPSQKDVAEQERRVHYFSYVREHGRQSANGRPHRVEAHRRRR